MSKKSTKSRSTKTSTKRKITPDDLLKFQLVADPRISPDGSRVLFTKRHVGEKNNAVSNLWVVDVEGGEPRQFTAGGKDDHGRWSPDGEMIAFVSDRNDGEQQIYTMPAAGGEAVKLTSFPEGVVAGFQWSPDGKSLAVKYRETEPEWTQAAKKEREETGGSTPARVIDQMYYRLDGDGYFNDQRFGLYIVDTKTGEHRALYTKDTAGWFDYSWSPDSKELVLSANTAKEPFLKYWKYDLVIVNAKSGKSRKLKVLPEGVKTAVAWSPDGKRIAYSGRDGREHWGVRNTHLFLCDPDGKNVRNLTSETDYCLSAITLSDTAEAAFEEAIEWSPDSNRLFMNFGWQGGLHIASVPAGGGEVVMHTSGRKTVGMGNLNAEGTRFAVTMSDQTTLPEIGVAGLPLLDSVGPGDDKLNLDQLTHFNKPLLKELDVSKPETHWIESAAGTKIQLWVMKPPGFKKGRKYPAILEIHGGPHCQYGEAFFHEMQCFAAAGYVVVFSNPRGSKGYGEEHCTAILGDWGTADWEDVQAVTAFMKEQPFIDAKRMGVCGGSYGGYMTNWVIGHTNEFAAAVTDRCVANLISMVGSSDLPLVPGEYWRGNSWDETETLWEQSPLKYFGNVETPTLVIHSEGDLRCNVEQSEQVFTALKLRGIPTRFVRYPFSTSHGMSRKGPPDLRLHRLGQYLDWWGRYLKD